MWLVSRRLTAVCQVAQVAQHAQQVSMQRKLINYCVAPLSVTSLLASIGADVTCQCIAARMKASTNPRRTCVAPWVPLLSVLLIIPALVIWCGRCSLCDLIHVPSIPDDMLCVALCYRRGIYAVHAEQQTHDLLTTYLTGTSKYRWSSLRVGTGTIS